MRRSLTLTVAAAVSMVLLAMLVPMGLLLRSYALEDRLSRAALEVQATETVVAGQDPGAVSVYLGLVNRGTGTTTTVFYPPDADHPQGYSVPESGAATRRVVATRNTGLARVDDVAGGAEFLVPVSLSGNTAAPGNTPVIRVRVEAPGLESGILRIYLALVALGLVLLLAALALADRIGRGFVQPVRALAAYAGQLGDRRRPDPVTPSGPLEVRELAGAMNRLVGRIEVLLARERDSVADVSHRLRTPMTALRLRVDSLTDPGDRERLGADLDELDATVDHVVREARRSQREGLVPEADAVAVVTERTDFWEALAEDQGRALVLVVDPDLGAGGAVPARVRAAEEDLQALVDVLLDNVFSHTPDGADLRVELAPRPGGGVLLLVDDAGSGFPDGVDVTARGTSGAGSTGLGLAIAVRTAEESGGSVALERSPAGGGRVRVELGPPT